MHISNISYQRRISLAGSWNCTRSWCVFTRVHSNDKHRTLWIMWLVCSG